MFDNLLHQNVTSLLKADIQNDRLPGSILFAGPDSSGKLTAALEVARVLSCKNKGEWLCTCSSCVKSKSLTLSNLLLAGPRDCILEIAAAKSSFLKSALNNDTHIVATRYLFLRAVRKLTLRFDQILWQNDDKLSKLSAFTSSINESLEEIDFPHEIPSYESLVKICDSIYKQCEKLEADYMYDSLPVNQIRNASAWAHITVAEGKKVIIIEKADRMLESVRNAMLKILEEPPANTIFILTTSRKGAVMPTILSRVRPYIFMERTPLQQKELVSRIYHEEVDIDLDSYLHTFLPIAPSVIKENAENFFNKIANSGIPEVQKIVSNCGKFDPRVLMRIFLEDIIEILKQYNTTPSGIEASAECIKSIKKCWNNITIYNQTPQAALENLLREIASINKTKSFVFKKQ